MNPLKLIIVGLLFTISLLVVAYFTILTEGGPIKKEGVSLVVYFPNADGLKVGNRVTVQGVPYGYISSIDLVQVDEQGNILPKGQIGVTSKVEVKLTLKGPIVLYENYSAVIKNESILSGRIIALDPGSRYPLDPKSQEPDTSQGEVLILGKFTKDNSTESLPPLRGRVTEDPLVSLSELIAENRADIRKIINNIAEATTKINQGQGTIGKLINETDLHKNVNTTLTDAQIVLRELREGLEDFREQAPVTSFIRAALSAF